MYSIAFIVGLDAHNGYDMLRKAFGAQFRDFELSVFYAMTSVSLNDGE